MKRDFLARVFARFVPVTLVSISHWFIAFSMPAVIGQSNYFDFGFVKTAFFSLLMTIRRFEGLVDREWLRGGHPFGERCVKVGLSPTRYKGQGAVFLLFLDCVWQVISV